MKFVSVAEDEAMEGCIYGLDYKGEHKYSEGTVVLRALTWGYLLFTSIFKKF